MEIYQFNSPRPRILVVSHERSGTHFLMNSMAKGFEYVSNPWIDFDARVANINFHHAESVRDFFLQFRAHNVANTFKSHHSADFFRSVFADIGQVFHVLYVHRDPRDVMRSFWKYLHPWPWLEGPRTESLSDFVRAEPCGHMMRYQMYQAPSVVHRWEAHVKGWLDLAETTTKIVPVAFESLRDDYAATIDWIGKELGITPVSHEPPAKEEDGILPGTGTVEGKDAAWTEADEAFLRDTVGKTMTRLGY